MCIRDRSCDVWSVGILLFCMLTGTFPWEQATLSDSNYYKFVQWQCRATSKPPCIWQNFSPELLSLFNKMLAMHPEDRCSITEVYKYLNESWLVVDNSFRMYTHCSESSQQCGLNSELIYSTSLSHHFAPLTTY